MWCFEEGSVVFVTGDYVIALRVPGISQVCVFFPRGKAKHNASFCNNNNSNKVQLLPNQVCGLEPWYSHL